MKRFLARALLRAARHPALAADALRLAPGLSFTDDSSGRFPIEGEHMDEGVVAGGRARVAFFGAAHCCNTNREAERLVALYPRFRDRVRFVVVDVEHPSPAQRALMHAHYHDAIPAIAVFDPSGNVVYAESGETAPTRGDTSQLAAIIARGETVSEPVAAVNTTDGLALRGYDPVAYFTTATPTPGLERYTWVWQGASYRFASADDLAAFRDAPERYAPQYGGYCAMAMSLDRIADADPTQWAIVGGKLYVNNNPSAHAAWSKGPVERIGAADEHWARRQKAGGACDTVCHVPDERP
jgi:hypothetical protein